MAAHVSVRDTDRGYAALVQRLYGASASAPVVRVGILSADGDVEHGRAPAPRADGRDANGHFLSKSARAKLAAAYVRKAARAANDSPDKDRVTVLQVAIFNEFGTGNIPERSFLRAWFDENDTKIRQTLTTLMRSVVAGKRTKDDVLDILGQWCVGEIQKRMASGIGPENAASTVKMKGSSKPLIDTGVLRSSVSYDVVGR